MNEKIKKIKNVFYPLTPVKDVLILLGDTIIILFVMFIISYGIFTSVQYLKARDTGIHFVLQGQYIEALTFFYEYPNDHSQKTQDFRAMTLEALEKQGYTFVACPHCNEIIEGYDPNGDKLSQFPVER